MKFVLVLCILMVIIFNDVQVQAETIVAADQNAQSRSNDQNRLIIGGGGGVVAADSNAKSSSIDQVQLIAAGIVAADQNGQNRAGQIKLQSVVQG